jgi:cellulose/xylan binding protein with CBM9 domain
MKRNMISNNTKYYVIMVSILLICLSIVSVSCNKEGMRKTPLVISDEIFPIPQIDFSPENYICYYTDQPIVINGKLSDRPWRVTEWTNEFVDIEGDLKPRPRFETRVKMLWDSNFIYFAALMEEPHVWAKLTERDAVIYYDNDFEVFIDPDGDTHEYYELEVNALNTQWDLFLVKPYRDGAPAINSWDIQGLQTAVVVGGTINNATDLDDGWVVEIAIPWNVLKECAHKDSPPKDGDQWRLNFSRVEWVVDTLSGTYEKLFDTITNKHYPENNWVWSPQGLIAMHYPEMWGFVQFSEKAPGSEDVDFVYNEIEDTKWNLRKLYYEEKQYKMIYGKFTDNLELLSLNKIDSTEEIWPPIININPNQFEAYVILNSGDTLSINHEGRTFYSRVKN